MHVLRILSIIFLAGYLIFQGLYYLAELQSPTMHAAIGLLGLGSGALIFISLSHWVNLKKELKRK